MVVMTALKDAAVSARRVVNVVAVMASAAAVVAAMVGQMDEVMGANRVAKVALKAVNRVRTVEEKGVAASVANVIRKERRAKSAQPGTQHSVLKVARPANLVKAANNVNRASPVKLAATAVNVVVVTAQCVAASAMVSALSATRQSRTWHSPTRRLWPQPWAASRSSVQMHHKVSGLHVEIVASAVTVVVRIAVTATAAVASTVMTVQTAAGML